MTIDRSLPGQEFVNRQLVTIAGFLKAEKATADSGDDFGLAPDDPAFGICGRKIGHGQRTTVRTNDITYAGSELLIGHDTLYTL